MAAYDDKTMDGQGEPAKSAFTVSPNDTVVFATMPRALYVGGAGNVAVTMFDGTVVTFVGVLAGEFLPIRVQKVMSTNTTATCILGLY